MLKSRAIWFFSTSNPTLTFGGFEGESKKEMYDLLPEKYFPKTIYINPQQTFEQVLEKFCSGSFSYPFIVKPDVGMEGILFRKIDNEQHLETYHRNMPVQYIIQEFVDYPLEIGVFYYRHPSNNSGTITALFSKQLPLIKGDGISTIKEIVEKEQPEIAEELLKLDKKELDRVLNRGEIINLSFIGNRYHGTTFHDLSEHIDNALLELFDTISHGSRFYYGRYDIKCASIEDLKKGINFSILEFNGAGSIPNHIYTGRHSLIEAYKEIAKHWKVLYQISRYNHKAGLPYWNIMKGARYLGTAKKHFRFLKKCNSRLVLKSKPVESCS
ncbi:MAG TPA: hypothetical protein VLS85_03230 [Hanamia sp.]|nr:hypothetical protein [Hanamia sp.]